MKPNEFINNNAILNKFDNVYLEHIRKKIDVCLDNEISNEVIINKERLIDDSIIKNNSLIRWIEDEQINAIRNRIIFVLPYVKLEENFWKFPSSWWQMFKFEKMPRWFKNWFPVKFIKFKMTHRLCLPGLRFLPENICKSTYQSFYVQIKKEDEHEFNETFCSFVSWKMEGDE